ncbi:MAG: response regulator transcription factor [Pontibacterium sp.]
MDSFEGKRLLIVDDDETFTRILSRALGRHGLEITVAHSPKDAREKLKDSLPDFATVDLKMDEASGLTLIPDLIKANPDMKVLILTGYASITTAVEAIKLGATNYLPKPADANEILSALTNQTANPDAEIAEQPMSVNRLEWEHIQKVLAENEGNISATARALNMHRRTLQRKLAKKPVRQ